MSCTQCRSTFSRCPIATHCLDSSSPRPRNLVSVGNGFRKVRKNTFQFGSFDSSDTSLTSVAITDSGCKPLPCLPGQFACLPDLPCFSSSLIAEKATVLSLVQAFLKEGWEGAGLSPWTKSAFLSEQNLFSK